LILSLYIIITWLVVSTFVYFPRKISLFECVFTFLFISLIIMNKSTITSLVLKYITITNDPVIYLSHILHRSIITPFSILLLCNLFYNTKILWRRYAFVLIILAFLILLEYIGTVVGVITYVKWGLHIEFLFLIMYSLMALLAAKWFKKRLDQEGILL
jgi:hypothetical protein